MSNFIDKLSPKYIGKIIKIVQYRINRIYHERVVFMFLPKQLRFRSIWRHNYWGAEESSSGPGSTLEQASNLISNFPYFLDKFGIKSLIDAPCGDFNWMNIAIKNAPKIHYIGGDVVPEIIQFLNVKYQIPNVEFRIFDITKDKFPISDVWLARAIFFHLSNRDIYRALENFVKSEIPYILTTNCVTELDHKNTDIKTGGWRSLNLKLPPFNFPAGTLWEIDDSKYPQPKMKLSLWTRSQVESILPGLNTSLCL
jgi:hypothetical protein